MLWHRLREKNSLKEEEVFREMQREKETAVYVSVVDLQNFPNRNVSTPAGPLRSAFVATGEFTPETYR